MNIKELTKRAMEIRAKYAEFEANSTGREWTNLNLMEGFVGDVGDLMKLVMAKEGVRGVEEVDEELAHELADCLWSILVLSKKYDIDLEKAFTKNMNELDKKLTEENKL